MSRNTAVAELAAQVAELTRKSCEVIRANKFQADVAVNEEANSGEGVVASTTDRLTQVDVAN